MRLGRKCPKKTSPFSLIKSGVLWCHWAGKAAWTAPAKKTSEDKKLGSRSRSWQLMQRSGKSWGETSWVTSWSKSDERDHEGPGSNLFQVTLITKYGQLWMQCKITRLKQYRFILATWGSWFTVLQVLISGNFGEPEVTLRAYLPYTAKIGTYRSIRLGLAASFLRSWVFNWDL